MPQDKLDHALFDARERRKRAAQRSRKSAAPRPRRGRPRAFDTFHTLSIVLLALGLALQAFAIVYYS